MSRDADEQVSPRYSALAVALRLLAACGVTAVARAAGDHAATDEKRSSRTIAADVIRSRRPATARSLQAPPLREIYLKYPIEQLEGGFAEGMAPDTATCRRSNSPTEQVAAILIYLGSITGVDPSSRQRVTIPGETPP